MNVATPLSTASIVFACAGFAALVAGAGLSLRVILPQFAIGELTSLIYYGHVARKYKNRATAHHEDLIRMLSDPEELSAQLAHQKWANSTVARQKHLYSSWGLLAVAVAILLVSVATSVRAIG